MMIPAMAININTLNRIIVITFVIRIHLGFTGAFILL